MIDFIERWVARSAIVGWSIVLFSFLAGTKMWSVGGDLFAAGGNVIENPLSTIAFSLSILYFFVTIVAFRQQRLVARANASEDIEDEVEGTEEE